MRPGAPTSGSARRRIREQLHAEKIRLEGEQLARDWNELRQRQKLESNVQGGFDVEPYEPWGRAGGGAPNPRGIRFTDIRAKEIYPEDELRGVQLPDGGRSWGSSPLRRRRRQTPLRIREDPQCYYADNLRKSVDDHFRYRQTPDQQRCYKKILDEMVNTRQKALHDEMRRNLEFEQKMHQMEAPWGKPGPGGTMWRNPRNIGLNFAKSMGWTDQEIFDKMQGERMRQKRSSLALPHVKRDDDFYEHYKYEKENVQFPEPPDKLPDIGDNQNSPVGYRREIEEHYIRKDDRPGSLLRGKGKGKGKRSPMGKFRRIHREEEAKLMHPEGYEKLPKSDEFFKRVEERVKKPTPEEVILRATGGVELVPLLARRRRVGARTLPSSDVTRPPEQSCQWREMIDAEHLAILKHQMKVKSLQKEESRQNSAESVRRHHETWASLWGRPGHGAPQSRGRYARNKLAELLYVKPLEHFKNDPYL